MNFGQELKYRRRELRLTQAELSAILSRGDSDGSPTKRTVEDWEASRRIPMLVTQEGVFARLHEYRPAPKFRDIQEVSLPIFGTIPAGWPDHRAAKKPKRVVVVPRGKFPDDAFGLDVDGDSMNLARGRFGPVLPGQTVVLIPFTSKDEAADQIVAAMIDGRTTLKRLVCPKNAKCFLRAESSNPAFDDAMHPMDILTVQGVVVGKLQGQ